MASKIRMEFNDVIAKHKFDKEGSLCVRDKYIIKFEGYAYVLYKKIGISTDSWKDIFEEPIAHFKDREKLDIFLEILFDTLEEED